MKIEIIFQNERSGVSYFSSHEAEEILNLQKRNSFKRFAVGNKFDIKDVGIVKIVKIEMGDIVHPTINEVNAFLHLYVDKV